MIDTATIRENYSNMLDRQLIVVAKQDGHQISPEAFQLLKEEFKKRNLDSSCIEAAEQYKAALQQEQIQEIRESSPEEFSKAIWKYAIEEKENGKSDPEIIAGLLQRGLEEPDAKDILAGIENKLIATIDSLDNKMLVGGAAFFIGIFITLLTYSSAKLSGGSYIVTWGAILFGAIRFFTGLSEKKQYKRLLKKIGQTNNSCNVSSNP